MKARNAPRESVFVPTITADSIGSMRIALVSPYSWTFPGGVTRHIDSLARELLAAGHDVRVLTPVDPDDRKTRVLHRRRPSSEPLPDFVVPLGRTFSLPMNGAVSHLAYHGNAINLMRRELRTGGYDVIHIHEPIAPVVGWDACVMTGTPLVGTFHAYSAGWVPNTIARGLGASRLFNRLHARIAVSEAARWTGERWFGGTYEVIPNGVDLDCAPSRPKSPNGSLRILFVGREEERKGLPVLLSAFAGLRRHIPTHLDIVGAGQEGVEPLLAEVEGGMENVEAHGHVSDDELWRRLHEADVLCAPSLGGESFGMVLTEAFAAGTPVVASDIAGYRQVVTHGRDGLLVPHGRPLELAEALRSLWLDPARRQSMGEAARARAEDFAWPRVAAQVAGVYERAIEAPAPVTAGERAGVTLGLRPADMSPRVRARRLESLEPAPLPDGRTRKARILAGARRAALGISAVVGLLLAFLALRRVGFHNVVSTLVQSSPSWVLIALALFSTSMILRAVSWYEIVRAALPERPVKRGTILSGTVIGVLMSATLPARLGEPSRALIVSRRLGRMRETLPVVAGTLVSQTLLNLLALMLLGAIVLGTSDVFRGREGALILFSLIPVALAAIVLIMPSVLESSDRRVGSRGGVLARLLREAAAALLRLRRGLTVFRNPRSAFWATFAQLSAWGLQLVGAFALMLALGLHGGIGAAAAVLFAVNVTAVLPATPSNVGVFQLAVLTVLTGAYGVPAASALGYGIILQAVEVVTAVAFGLPALIREGVSWRDVRMRALAASPVELSPRSRPLPEAQATTGR
jgi:phosphatidyl-myo-inositol alpha-mannosyltransferase